MIEQLAVVALVGAILSLALGLGDARVATKDHSNEAANGKSKSALVSIDTPPSDGSRENSPA